MAKLESVDNIKSVQSSYLGNIFVGKLREELKKELQLSNIMAVPKLNKIVVSAGCGKFHKDEKKITFMFEQIKALTGQLPVIAKARKSVAGFSIREGMTSGIFVTLRKGMMYNFLDRLVHLAMPRIRDFRGVSLKSFDGHGNLNIGVPMQDVFLEVQDDMLFGLNISIETTAKDDSSAKVLLEKLGIPFEERRTS
jgi:large subunit ribosomal protein L5